MDSSRRAYLFFLTLVALWCSLILVAPFLQSFSEQTTPVAAVIYKFFARICHQLDERSFHLNGEKLAVCIRCSAIYIAFLIGLLSFPFLKGFDNRKSPAVVWLAVACLPMVLDVALSVTGVHASTAITRLLTGTVLGVILPFYILPPLFESMGARSQHFILTKGEPVYARKTE